MTSFLPFICTNFDQTSSDYSVELCYFPIEMLTHQVSPMVYQPIFKCSHEHKVMTEKTQLQTQAVKVRFKKIVADLTITGRFRSAYIRRSLRIEPPLRHTQRTQGCLFSCVLKTQHGRLFQPAF